MKFNTFVGLDVHLDFISVAVALEGGGRVLEMGKIPNNEEAIRKLVNKLGRCERVLYCYEAGPCGYSLYRFLISLGVSCMVVAPSLVPKNPGQRVKTDRRDARKLAELARAGLLTPVWVPDERHEALRDLLRAREDAVKDHLRKRHQLVKFLQRTGLRPPEKVRAWTKKHRRWLESIRFDEPARQIVLCDYLHAVDEAKRRIEHLEREILAYAQGMAEQRLVHALQALRGVGLVTALTLVAELGDMSRFERAGQLMSYAGMISGEYSSGKKRRQGAITKTGNAHIRWAVVEAAWHYRHRPLLSAALKKRQTGLSPEIKAIAWKAQNRLNRKYRRLLARGKNKQTVVVAIARELLGFIWAIAKQVAVEETMSKAA